MTDLTVACVFVRGPYPYTPDYVIRLSQMVRRHLSRPYRFVCLTDRPWLFQPPIETIPIQVHDHPADGYWGKVRLFDRSSGLTGRVLFLDLDTLIVAPLDPIVDYPASLALTTDALVEERKHLKTDRFGRALVRKFNSSVMVWDAGAHDYLWDFWGPQVAQRLSTDQDWIGEQAEHAAGMPIEWFPRISQVQPPWPEVAKVVLCKKPKNHEAVARWPSLRAWWGEAA